MKMIKMLWHGKEQNVKWTISFLIWSCLKLIENSFFGSNLIKLKTINKRQKFHQLNKDLTLF